VKVYASKGQETLRRGTKDRHQGQAPRTGTKLSIIPKADVQLDYVCHTLFVERLCVCLFSPPRKRYQWDWSSKTL
jgi:hypothetical protein